ncbi:hypothetical protein [Lactobacillus johnsonii]|uniref:Uncharacterized protein n=1 Tax=Lactobacillus johnsonii TaxID=33959 RepID=A0A9X4XAH4_LACJH|nr:hypothetical protein [Lactobacillus johnsonii]MTE03583.1 hypothetical protein [Lactobacillus johnsonii]
MSYYSDLKAKAEAGNKDAKKKLEDLRIYQKEYQRKYRQKRQAKAEAGDKDAIAAIEKSKISNRKSVKAYWARIKTKAEAGDKDAIEKLANFQTISRYANVKNTISNLNSLSELKKISEAIADKRKVLLKNNDK